MKQEQVIKRYVIEILEALQLKNCFCHIELRLDTQMRPSIIEVNPRVGGMYVTHSLKALRNLDFYSTLIDQITGNSLNLELIEQPKDYYSMLAIYPEHSGTLRKIHGLEEARSLTGVLQLNVHYQVGEHIGGDFEEVFVVDAWITSPTCEGILALDNKIKQLIRIEVTV